MFRVTKLVLASVAMIAGLASATVLPRADAAVLGSSVENIASVTYGSGPTPTNLLTPPAVFTIEAQRTPSTIEFFRYSPTAPDASLVSINGADFSPTLDASGQPVFQPIGPPIGVNGQVLDFSTPAPLVSATAYYPGELIIISVTDLGQNGDPATIETIVATVSAPNGDALTLRLYESGPDTGQFFAYFPSVSASNAPADPGDKRLAIEHGTDLFARYQDPFDATEISVDVAIADPFGRVFDSVTGAMIDGALITIIDDATGQPALVLGIDGFSIYPSSVTSGESVTDASGLVYAFSPGEFRFPILPPGRYRLVVEPPGAYVAPTTALESNLTGLPSGPFVISEGSFIRVFTVAATGPSVFDLPLDPVTELVISKSASTETGAIGDFIRYEIEIENRGDGAEALSISDSLPRGFRYQSGSVRRDGANISEPIATADGRTLILNAGAVLPGETVTLSYVLEISSGASQGEAINRAVVVNGAGIALSNFAEALVFVREDLLRSRLTIAGRVAENACNPEDDWPREINDGEGVAGVRLYMENGAYAVTDKDGLFHFEDIEARTHIVQVDEVTLPDGYEPVLCEENSRYAGNPISQFVDAKGGGLWRANFYLRKTDAAAAGVAETAPGAPETFNDATEYLNFDKEWLNGQDSELEWAYPEEGRTPSAPSVNLGLKHIAGLKVELSLNGVKVPGANFAGRIVGLDMNVALTRWRSVDLLDGENIFVATLLDQNGAVVGRMERRVFYIDTIARAVHQIERSHLVADGRTPPVLAVRLTDGAGRPVHAGRLVTVQIDEPFKARASKRLEDQLPLTDSLAAVSSVPAGPDGVAMIELEPTLQTGKVRLEVRLDDGRTEEITAYIKPELRDWIVVGLVEGQAGLERSHIGGQPNPGARELIKEGRVAVFAKGAVKGDWLITMAADSAKKRGTADDELFDVIDPDARYSLYGDRSEHEFEAQSRYAVYLKAEKDAFSALLGDYDTDLLDTKLGRYTRRMSGVKTVYEGDRFSFSGFAAETNQAFVKDEIAADGTSGPFALTSAPLVRNSEKIVIETRNRFRPDEIIASTSLVRYADYDIDFRTGEIIFRLPVPAADANFNPNILVIDYETAAPVERNLTAGGRVAAHLFDDRAEIGATLIHEEGRNGEPGGNAELAAVDLRVDVSATTQARFEYGATRRDFDTGEQTGDAMLAELDHVSGNLTAKAYFSKTDENFGLNQQTSATVGVKRYGVEARYKFNEFGGETGPRGARYVEGQFYREENLRTGATRQVADFALRQESATTSGAVGLRQVKEKPATGPDREALLVTAEATQTFPKLGLTVRGRREQPINNKNQSTLFPKRTIVGFDQRFSDRITLNVNHEVQDGETGGSQNTIVGLTVTPWAGGQITAATDFITQDSGSQIGATLGVDQQVQINDKWSTSFGMTRRQALQNNGVIAVEEDIVPDSPTSPFEQDEEYTSLYVGAGYRTDRTTGSARFELKKSVLGDRYTGVLGAAREISDQLSFAGAARYQQEENIGSPDRRDLDARFGMAWRPRGEGLIALNRFDIKHESIAGQSESWKAINNLALNAMITERFQLSANHGFKYSVLDADGVAYQGITQLAGLEGRYDLTEWLDIGVHGSALYSHNANTIDYSYGPSIGVNPGDNIWLTLGWNFDGFIDDDFMGAEFSHEGPYLKMRIKFDQHSAGGLLDAISPGGGQ